MQDFTNNPSMRIFTSVGNNISAKGFSILKQKINKKLANNLLNTKMKAVAAYCSSNENT